jgi:ribosome-binding ATPase YchF (GTP1/OBG family)
MRIALVGLKGSGKTTLFNAIADTPVSVPGGGLQSETHVQVVKVKDERLERCRELFQPKKYTPTGLEIWDPPGLPPGSSEADKERRIRLLSSLREADAFVIVARGFATDLYPYDRPQADPAADLKQVVDELLLADFVVTETRVTKLRDNVQKKAKSLEQDKLELAVLERCLERLEAGRHLGDLEVNEQDAKRLRGFQLFARKPFLAVLNGPGPVPKGFGEGLGLPMRGVITIDAQIEAEVAAMAPADRAPFLEEFGLAEPAASRFVHELYKAVGLRSFFTVGEDEVRAWTIQAGDDAITAAGKIHTDLAKGFVRAEVFHYDELISAGGMRELKARNGVRLEPKDYVVKDGDIVHIRSAV